MLLYWKIWYCVFLLSIAWQPPDAFIIYLAKSDTICTSCQSNGILFKIWHFKIKACEAAENKLIITGGRWWSLLTSRRLLFYSPGHVSLLLLAGQFSHLADCFLPLTGHLSQLTTCYITCHYRNSIAVCPQPTNIPTFPQVGWNEEAVKWWVCRDTWDSGPQYRINTGNAYYSLAKY